MCTPRQQHQHLKPDRLSSVPSISLTPSSTTIYKHVTYSWQRNYFLQTDMLMLLHCIWKVFVRISVLLENKQFFKCFIIEDTSFPKSIFGCNSDFVDCSFLVIFQWIPRPQIFELKPLTPNQFWQPHHTHTRKTRHRHYQIS